MILSFDRQIIFFFSNHSPMIYIKWQADDNHRERFGRFPLAVGRSLVALIRGVESEPNQFSGVNSGKIQGARRKR